MLNRHSIKTTSTSLTFLSLAHYYPNLSILVLVDSQLSSHYMERLEAPRPQASCRVAHLKTIRSQSQPFPILVPGERLGA